MIGDPVAPIAGEFVLVAVAVFVEVDTFDDAAIGKGDKRKATAGSCLFSRRGPSWRKVPVEQSQKV